MTRYLCRIVMKCVVLALLSCCASSAFAETHHALWKVKGQHNTVYLLGSVHVLKSGMTLPPPMMAAFQDAKILVMELDRDNLTAGALKDASLQLETLPDNQTLSGVLGPERYKEFQVYANSLGFDTDFMTRYQPWFAAMTLQIYGYEKSGFSVLSGVERQLLDKVHEETDKAGSKRIIGLETIEQQLKLFAHLSMEEQRQYLHQTIQEHELQSTQLQAMIDAWQNGDVVALEKYSRQAFEESPDFYRTIVTNRNKNWLPKFVELLNGNGDCLIVVGVLHLVGHDGMIDLLQQRGYHVEQQ